MISWENFTSKANRFAHRTCNLFQHYSYMILIFMLS